MKMISLFFALFLSVNLFAQTHASDIMHQKTVVRALDLREPQNISFLSQGNEITQLFMDAILNKEITAYANDSLKTVLSIDDFKKKITLPELVIQDNKDDWCCNDEDTNSVQNTPQVNYYFAKDLYQMEMTEKVIFNKEKSVTEYDIQSITFFIPADHPDNVKGIQLPIATFKYQDCVKLFKNNPKAIWYNAYNESTHLNLADAFELRLFSSYIIKVSNPKDEYLQDVYGYGKNSIVQSKVEEFKQMEFEHHLWEQ